MAESTWTIPEAARLLDKPQHRLIYLCEKGVVIPDHGDAAGRQTNRLASMPNLLEFGIAFRLREFEISASIIATVLHVLRAFERQVALQIPAFRLPESLRAPRSPDLRVVISDGEKLFFTLRAGKTPAKVYGGLDLRKASRLAKKSPNLGQELARGAAVGGSLAPEAFGHPEGSRHVRVEISVSQIARDLRLSE